MVLRLLDSGSDVVALTETLTALGLLPAPTPIFGPEVAAAVRRFQSKHLDPRSEPLVIDGEVGPMTAWALDVATGRTPAPAARRPALTMPATGGSPIGRKALAVALGEYAAGAEEIGDSNLGPWVVKYQNNDPALAGEPWCASFVSWCFETACGGVSPFGYDASARGVLARFKARGWVYAASTDRPPEPGDIIVWWREPIGAGYGHIGLVHSYENGIVRTIEGNRGPFPSPVGTYTYVLGRIDRLLGFGRVLG